MKQTGNKQIQGKRIYSPNPQVQAPQKPPAPQPAGSMPSTSFTGEEAQPSFWARLRVGERVLLPLRLFLGVTFVYAGIQKLTDPQFFNPRAIGYIGKQIIAFATGSPLHYILIRYAVPHAVFFGLVVALGEIAIGLGALFGFLLRPASFFGLLLSLLFFLSASWHVYPYFYGADIVFVFAWITLLLAGPLRSGYPSLDGAIVPRLLNAMQQPARASVARLSSFFLGVGDGGTADIYDQSTQRLSQVNGQPAAYNSSYGGYPQGMPQQYGNNQGRGNMQGAAYARQPMSTKSRIAAERRAQENRRNFLWGLVAGGLGMLGITLAGRVIHLGGDDTGTNTLPSGSTGSTGGTQTTPSTSGSSNTIAQASQVPTNSAVTFTIPSNGDPGVLVHLKSGKFACFDATCTHAGCPVSFDSGSGLLICPCHGAEFDPANNAAVVNGPAQSPLTGVPININNSTGAITLQ
jgi:thiosulfate dehydrogenase [quinone] large subunit